MSTPLVRELGLEETDAPIILVLGETGAGKSYFINALVPGSVQIGYHSESCTQKPQLVSARVNNKEFLLVDTPGFNDTYRSDGQILAEIACMLTLQKQLGVKLRGVLYLHDILPARMSGSSMRQLDMLKRIVGPANYGNVVLVTTRWPSNLSEAVSMGCAVREGDLRRTFWADLIRAGSRMMRFNGNESMAQAVVRHFFDKGDIMLALEAEMETTGGSLEATTAGAFVIDARRRDEEAHRAWVESLEAAPPPQREYQQEHRHVDDELRKRMEELYASLKQRERDEANLKKDIVSTVKSEIVETVDKEVKKSGVRPTVVNIVSWLIGVGSLTLGIVGQVLG